MTRLSELKDRTRAIKESDRQKRIRALEAELNELKKVSYHELRCLLEELLDELELVGPELAEHLQFAWKNWDDQGAYVEDEDQEFFGGW